MRVLADKIVVVPNHGHDWLDHVWGWSQVGGAILALVALGIALWSRRDARDSAAAAARSAEAAERTASAAEISAANSTAAVELAQEELAMLKADASRRPVLHIDASITRLPSTPALREMVLRLEFSNTGDADAEGTVINVIAPTGTTMAASTHGGMKTGDIPTVPTPEDLDGSGSAVYGSFPCDVPRATCGSRSATRGRRADLAARIH
jgi:hypothetical protein